MTPRPRSRASSPAPRSGGRRHGLPRPLAALAALLAAAPGAAQDSADVDPFHWGYAAMFGGGDYRLTDGTEARMFRLPLRKTLREPAGGRVGVRLLLPLTAGIQNLDEDELPPDRPDDEVEQAGILPGLELEFNPGERWALRVRGQFGWGTELEGAEESARLFAAGVRSRVTWSGAPGRPSVINGLLWAGYDPETTPRRSLMRLTNALEFDVAVPRWEFRDETMHLMPHVLGEWYYRPPDALSFGNEESRQLDSEWQIGVAAGREGGFEVLGFELDAVGIAYRFSEHRAGIRFYLGSVF